MKTLPVYSLLLGLLLPYSTLVAAPKGSSTFQPKITAVGPDSITIKSGAHAGLKAKNVSTGGTINVDQANANIDVFKVSTFTTITVDGLPGKLTDLKRGMSVLVRQGSDPTVAAAINASTIPPPLPPAAPTPKPAKGTPTKAAFHKLEADRVLSVGADRITIGQRGSDKARAYLVSSFTVILVNGAPGKLSEIREGMAVQINASGQTSAGRIEAKVADD